MKKAISVNKKSRGRPKRPEGVDPVSAVRLPTELTNGIDEWRRKQSDLPSHSEAIRRLVELGLAASVSSRPRSPKSRAKAADMAHEVLDRHADQTATLEEQASRKRRLLKGPKEFRELRRDHPAGKRTL